MPLPSGLFNQGQKIEDGKDGRCKIDDGMLSAEISVICGKRSLAA